MTEKLVTEALVALLADPDPKTRRGAIQVLIRSAEASATRSRTASEQSAVKQHEMAALQAIMQMITNQPWAALVAYEKLLAGQVLMPADGRPSQRLSVGAQMTATFSVMPGSRYSIGCGPGKRGSINRLCNRCDEH